VDDDPLAPVEAPTLAPLSLLSPLAPLVLLPLEVPFDEPFDELDDGVLELDEERESVR
jgi:hypothetical protein